MTPIEHAWLGAVLRPGMHGGGEDLRYRDSVYAVAADGTTLAQAMEDYRDHGFFQARVDGHGDPLLEADSSPNPANGNASLLLRRALGLPFDGAFAAFRRSDGTLFDTRERGFPRAEGFPL